MGPPTQKIIFRYNINMANSSVKAYYYPYRPYLQPTPNLGGTSTRVAGALTTVTRAKFGSIQRIYAFAKARGQLPQFYNQVLFAVYGV